VQASRSLSRSVLALTTSYRCFIVELLQLSLFWTCGMWEDSNESSCLSRALVGFVSSSKPLADQTIC
jgi:hypothetical protein